MKYDFKFRNLKYYKLSSTQHESIHNSILDNSVFTKIPSDLIQELTDLPTSLRSSDSFSCHIATGLKCEMKTTEIVLDVARVETRPKPNEPSINIDRYCLFTTNNQYYISEAITSGHQWLTTTQFLNFYKNA